ncbi:MAG: IPTL-CTERM sorting domain-containing protein [Elusimicrobia bacterium]|nr:IPTL-CTERM sorting domain-containing protein [Elusimicrobiota bacterium]
MTRALPLWLLAAALALPVLGLTSPLIEVDDARYAQVPAEMVRSGDWILPTLDGTPYVEKPPLWYWTAAASYEVFGVSEAAARLPMWLFGLLGVLGAGWLGTWLYSAAVGRAAAAATATAGLWLFLNHNMTLDLPVSVCLLWATALALRTLARPEDARWAAPAAWLAAALAFLSKGLIALLLPGLWVVGLSVLFPKLRRGALKLLSPAGLILFAAAVVPWFAAMQRRRPDFLHVFFVEQHFQRYLTPKYNRGAPWWFYLAVVPAGMLPWTAPFLAGMWRAARKPFGPDFRGPALGYWVLGVCAFFSTSHSKLATYALPVFPHAAVLAAAALDEGLPAWAKKLSRALGVLLLAAAAAGAAAALGGFLPAKVWPPAGLPPQALTPLSVLLFGLLAALGAAQLAAPSLKAPAAALTGGGALAGVFLFAGLRLAAPLTGARALGLAVGAEARAGDAVWTYDNYPHGLPFYARRPVDKIVQFTGEFHYAKRDPAFADRFGDADALKALPRAGGRTFVAMHSARREDFLALLGGGAASVESWQDFGAWSLAVVKAAR